MFDFLSSSAWQGVAAIIALVTLFAPAVTHYLRRQRKMDTVVPVAVPHPYVPTRADLTGCGGALKSVAFLWCIKLVHILLAASIGVAAVTASSELASAVSSHRVVQAQASIVEQIGPISCIALFGLILETIMNVWAVSLGRRYGYPGIALAGAAYNTAAVSLILPLMQNAPLFTRWFVIMYSLSLASCILAGAVIVLSAHISKPS